MSVAAFLLAVLVCVPLAYVAVTSPFRFWDWIDAHSGWVAKVPATHWQGLAFLLVWAVAAWL